MRKLTLLLCILVTSACAHAQDSIPLVTGTVRLSILTGTIACDLTLTDMPRIQDYLIRINSGMNIRSFRNIQPDFLIGYEREVADSTATYESNDYWFPGSQTKKWLPKAVRFRYLGMYPVITDTALKGDVSREDWKGNIAFNGYSVRADGYQACWYPVLYDVKHGKTYEKVRYDLTIDCPDCSVIYINGSTPVKGSHAHLVSSTPREMLLYAGNFPLVYEGGAAFLNPDMDEAHLRSFGAMTERLKHYYESHLKIPYKDTITYIQTTPTAPDHAWMFVSYPSIVNIGFGQYAMKSFAEQGKQDGFMGGIAHELGHYYFGTYRRFEGAFGEVLDEGFSEFLALHALQHLLPDSLYHKKMAQKLRALQHFTPLPFSGIKTSDDLRNGELYRYYYSTFIFEAIEKELGEDAAWRWMYELLTEPEDGSGDYAFLVHTLGVVVNNPARLEALKAKYFEGDHTLDNAIAEIGFPPAAAAK